MSGRRFITALEIGALRKGKVTGSNLDVQLHSFSFFPIANLFQTYELLQPTRGQGIGLQQAVRAHVQRACAVFV